MAYQSIFKNTPTKQSGGYQSIFGGVKKTTPATTDVRTVSLPEHLGGGEYKTSGPGTLIKEPIKKYGGLEPTHESERDHIVSWSLGGTNSIKNVEYKPSPRGKDDKWIYELRQGGKVVVERKTIDDYKDGKISLPQARLKIATKQQEIKGLIPKQGYKSYLASGAGKSLKDLGIDLLKAPVELTKQMGSNIAGVFDFVHRTGLQTISGIGTVTSAVDVSKAKLLGDKTLKDISYDDIWKQELEAGEQRMLDIGRPDEYFRSKVTGTPYQENQLFMGKADELAKSYHKKVAEGDTLGSFSDVSKIAAIGFVRDWANPFFLFSVKGGAAGSFKQTPKEKLLFQMEINPAKEGFLGKTKVKPQERIYKIESKPSADYSINLKGKVKAEKAPDIKMYVKRDKNGVTSVKVTNSGGEILDRGAMKTAIDQATGQTGTAISPKAPIVPKIAPVKSTTPLTAPKQPLGEAIAPKADILTTEAKKAISEGKTADEFIEDGLPTKAVYKDTYEGFFDNKPAEVFRGGDDIFGSIDDGGEAWFTVGEADAIAYADDIDKLKSAYLIMKNPLELRGNIKKIETITGEKLESMTDLSGKGRETIIEYAKKNNFDGVLMPDTDVSGVNTIESFVVWNKDQIKTKSQLTDIFNKAKKPVKKAPIKYIPEEKAPDARKKITTERTIAEPSVPNRIKNEAIEKGLIDDIAGGLDEYDKVSFKEQARLVGEIIDEDPQKAIRIALGKELPTNGALPESVFMAVKNQALKKGDVDLLLKLATEEGGVARESTVLGQRIKMLDETSKDDAFKKIRQVQKAKEKSVEKKLKNKKPKEVKKEIANKLKDSIEKTTPKIKDWNDFINSLKC